MGCWEAHRCEQTAGARRGTHTRGTKREGSRILEGQQAGLLSVWACTGKGGTGLLCATAASEQKGHILGTLEDTVLAHFCAQHRQGRPRRWRVIEPRPALFLRRGLETLTPPHPLPSGLGQGSEHTDLFKMPPLKRPSLCIVSRHSDLTPSGRWMAC